MQTVSKADTKERGLRSSWQNDTKPSPTVAGKDIIPYSLQFVNIKGDNKDNGRKIYGTRAGADEALCRS